MKNLCWIFAVLLSFVSCGELSDRARLQKIVEEWQGRQIVLPETVIDLLTGDTIDLSNSDFTILNYVDSVGCTSCKMKLALWNEFLSSIESISDYNVQSLTVIDPSKSQEAFHIIKRDGYEYPVCSDFNNNIYTLNQFNKAPGFNALLLDSNFKTILVGDPINNLTIRDLYIDIVKGDRIISGNGKQSIIVENNLLKLGKLHFGEQKTKIIRIKNESNDTIRIRDIKTSCNCIVAKANKEFILPKNDTEVSINFVADSIEGNFSRDIQIFYDGFYHTTNIEITGTICE